MYTLTLRVDYCCEDFEFDAAPTKAEIRGECTDWVSNGDWGDDGNGASVRVAWTLTCDDVELDFGFVEVDIAPDHACLIRQACGTHESCGFDPDDHDWTDENPGVWATGGTSLSISTHCRECGLKRVESITGSQRNPGECDRVRYEMPESWCAECEEDDA